MDTREILFLLPLWYVVFLLSMTCHEAAHAFAARRGGDDTAYLGGQVSLNPLPHVQRELFGTVVVPLLSFFLWDGRWMIGWASAPYDPHWEERHPRRAAGMAAAGPLANLLLALIGFAALKWGLHQGIWAPLPNGSVVPLDQLVTRAGEGTAAWEGLGRFCSVLVSLNLVLFLFNLIPLPPMDGAAVVAGLSAPARRLQAALRGNAFSGMFGLVIAWYLFGYVFRFVFEPVIRLLYR